MKVSIDWIKEYTELPDMDPVSLGEKMTLHTCEVEGVQKQGEILDKVFVAEVTGIKPHPNADKLQLVDFNAGAQGSGTVVCGAPNVRIGMKAPYAPIGTTLPIGFTLEPKKIRGVLSEGMLCAEDELGLSEDHEGLMVLGEEAVPGTVLGKYLGRKASIVFEIDNKSITNRPDLWGQYGMARELAAITGNTLKKPFNEEWKKKLSSNFNKEKSPVTITVEPDSCCLGYFGYTVDGITVSESPDWMQQRLLECGMRPINSIVDISNYVMLELGMPNHIFDRRLIEGGTIHVRRTGCEEEFVTLDEMTRKLVPSDTVVADSTKALVIAGIMGGANSGVNSQTDSVFVEVANWKDVEIRKTSTRIGLRTDSSLRYEKSLDSLSLERSALRIMELLLQLNPGAKVVGKLEYDGPDLNAVSIPHIQLEHTRMERLLGTSIAADQVRSILTALDFGIEAEQDGCYEISVPSYRATKDIECDADIIEEIGRIYGYDKLKPVPPLWSVEAVSLIPEKQLHRKVLDFMVLNAGAHEIMTYPLSGEAALKKADWPELAEDLILANALSPDRSRMRPSMVPGILEAAALNARNYDRFTLFEYGRVYLADKKDFSREQNHLVAVFYSKEENRFLDALNSAEKLFNYIGVPAQIKAADPTFDNPCLPRDWSGRHPHEVKDIMIMGKSSGAIVTLHPLLAKNYKIKGNLTLLLVNFADIESRELKKKTSYKALPRYPESVFDFTVLAEADQEAADVLAAAKTYRSKMLKDMKLVYIFGMESGQKAVTLRARFMDEEKTLSGEFLEQAQNELILLMKKAGFPLKT